jgi:hypothetical protein
MVPGPAPDAEEAVEFDFLGENGLKEPKKRHKSDILIPIKKIIDIV